MEKRKNFGIEPITKGDQNDPEEGYAANLYASVS